MKTAMQDMIDWIEERFNNPQETEVFKKASELLEKEKEQIKKAFSDGQETPINHPTIPHYSNEEYFNDNYNWVNGIAVHPTKSQVTTTDVWSPKTN